MSGWFEHFRFDILWFSLFFRFRMKGRRRKIGKTKSGSPLTLCFVYRTCAPKKNHVFQLDFETHMFVLEGTAPWWLAASFLCLVVCQS